MHGVLCYMVWYIIVCIDVLGHQMRVGSSKIAIFASSGRYIFPNFIYETKIITSDMSM